MAAERRELRPHPVHVEEPVDLPQQMIARHVRLQVEAVERRRRSRLPAHHRKILPATQNRVNQGTSRVATGTFSTK